LFLWNKIVLVTQHESGYKLLSAKENSMNEKSALDEALIAARIKAAAVVMKLQQSGAHWIFTAKPEKSK
jgi:hypothetical protein